MAVEAWYRHRLPPLPEHCNPTSAFLSGYSSLWQTCVPTNLAFISYLLGTLSIVSWLFAQLPQIWRNHHLQTTAGLSFYFLVEWCLGDLFNLLGAIFSDQAPWQVIVAGYYCFVDAVLVGQYLWYERLHHGKRVRKVPCPDNKFSAGFDRNKKPSRFLSLSFIASLFAVARAAPLPASVAPSGSISTAGVALSWLSTALYLVSRMPQLYQNFTRKSTAGLSAQLFFAAFCGNLFYSTSLLTNPRAWHDYAAYGGRGWVGAEGSDSREWALRALPFFLGAAGVLIMDASVGFQFILYGQKDMLVVIRDDGDSDEVASMASIGQLIGDGVHGVHAERVNGWMRGWQPDFREARVASSETQALLGAADEQGQETYGAADT